MGGFGDVFGGFGNILSKGITVGPVKLTIGDGLVAGLSAIPGAGVFLGAGAGALVEAAEEVGDHQKLSLGRILGSAALGGAGAGVGRLIGGTIAGRLAGKFTTGVAAKLSSKTTINALSRGIGAGALSTLMPGQSFTLPMREIGESNRRVPKRMVAAGGGTDSQTYNDELREYNDSTASDKSKNSKGKENSDKPQVVTA